MMITLRSWRDALPLQDPIEQRQGPLLQYMLLIFIAVNIIGSVLVLSLPGVPAAARSNIVTTMAISAVLNCTSLLLLRSGSFRPAVALTALTMVGTFLSQLLPSGLHSPWFIFFFLAIPIAFAAIMGSAALLWVTIAACILGVGLIGVLEQTAPALVGYVGGTIELPLIVPIVVFSLAAIALGGSFHILGGSLRGTLEQAWRQAQELDTLRATQEQIIAARTADLQSALDAIAQREASLRDSRAALHSSEATIMELSAPAIPILPGVLVIPLVGALDDRRVQHMVEHILRAVTQEHAHHLIIDITGVPVIDTYAGQVLLDIAQACRLLGAQVLLVGVRSEVAQTMVALNITLQYIQVFASLRDAINALLTAAGWQRVAGTPANSPPKKDAVH